MLPVVEPNGWQDPDYYCWGGAALIGPGEEGPETVHFYGTRWPRWSGFLGWLWRSEICRATSRSVTGPFTTREVLVDDRAQRRPDNSDYWDHHSVFNSTVLQHGGKVYVFYTGTQHDPQRPLAADEVPQTRLRMTQIRDGWERMHQRVGVLIGESPTGPWTRLDEPLLVPDEPWAPFFHSNPIAVIGPDGKCYLHYKSIDAQYKRMKFAVAIADHPAGPYRKYEKNPIVDPGPHINVEDRVVWVQNGRFHMLFKDLSGHIAGQAMSTMLLRSEDGLNWNLKEAELAYRPGWPTQDGFYETHRMEQPNLLMIDGEPAVLYCATLNADERTDPLHPLHRRLPAEQRDKGIVLASRNVAIPLARGH